jgi:cellobiose phosphorylase
MINPIEHSISKDMANKYKVEPYVISADIYGSGNLAGRGGWTWYTGSSSWYYKAGVEYILGLRIEKGIMKFKPCIPKDWSDYSIRYKWKNSVYNIRVLNPNKKSTGEVEVKLNGEKIENGILLDGRGNVYKVEVEIK